MTTQTKTFQAIIRNCQFNNNKILHENTFGQHIERNHRGGSIFCQRNANIDIQHCNFSYNTVWRDGGAIYAETNSIEINMCRFEHCTAKDQEIGKGGAIYLDQSSIAGFEFCSGNVFIDCCSDYSGGALFVYCRDEYSYKIS